MTDLDGEAVTNWYHQVGVHHVELPRSDALLLVAASTRPSTPIVVTLSGETAPNIDTDRDRAVLRAFLTLALKRLDTQEENTR